VDLPALIAALSRPDAYPHPVDRIEVHQTHISAVFLAGPYAYKIKKPVNLGFLNFSTLEKRKHFCEQEVRLNRRLAPAVYLGVVPITPEPDARASVEESFARASGSVAEWAVKMKRLPADATFESRLMRGEATSEQIRVLAARVADFHRKAETNERIASFGRFEVIAENARDNFKQTAAHVGVTVERGVFERLRELTEAKLSELQPLIDRRARRGAPRDTHGDLHLDHVYLFPNEEPPDDLVIVDCIEFSERFRCADPIADMAFLVMDLQFHGRRDLASVFADAYFDASGDDEGRALLPFYSAYRAIVRAKVEGMELSEAEIDAAEREDAQARAKAHWLLALGQLESPERRPAVVLIAGLPGSGKSTLAKAIAGPANFNVLRSDVVRKQLAGSDSRDIYSAAWSERTYAELLRQAEAHLRTGGRVLIDANFRSDAQRSLFFELARRWAVPIVFIHCHASPEVTRSRLQARRGDASDADWQIYQRLAAGWQPLRARWRVHEVDTSFTISENGHQVRAILQGEGLIA
jgi:aminoglycoside phosphotransferase family enzyme/predicted kinase